MASQKSGKGSPSRQAYYGSGVPMPPPYMSSPMMSGHPPHPMWGPPQGGMPPYGVPYQAMYPPGVVYAHPAVPLVAAPGTTQPSKISDARDRGSTKKVKRLETISAPVSNDGAEVDDEDSSWSQDQGFDASCDYSDTKAKDDRHLKREKRKQANRESARKSRMRKQAEVEELMERYESLKTENSNLSFEINHLMAESEKLRVENAALMEKLGDDDVARPGDSGGNFKPIIANSASSYEEGSEDEALENSDETNLLPFESRGDDLTS